MLDFSSLQMLLFQTFKVDSIVKLLGIAVQVEIAFYFQESFSHHEVIKIQMFSMPLSSQVIVYQVK